MMGVDTRKKKAQPLKKRPASSRSVTKEWRNREVRIWKRFLKPSDRKSTKIAYNHHVTLKMWEVYAHLKDLKEIHAGNGHKVLFYEVQFSDDLSFELYVVHKHKKTLEIWYTEATE